MNLVMKKDVSKVLLIPLLLALLATVVFQPTSASAHHSNDFRNFPAVYSGKTGNYVKFAQGFLAHRGYYSGAIDASFGPQTKAAVIAYQKANGLAQDGSIGPATWSSIRGKFSTVYTNQIRSYTSYDSVWLDTSSDYWEFIEHSPGGSSYVISSGYVR